MTVSVGTGQSDQTPGGKSHGDGGIGGNRSVSFFVKTGHVY